MIKSIDIENVRGISLNTHIDLDNKSLMIFGENGKGKSSIIDGIEYALTKDIKHISTACKEVSLQKHAPNIAASFQDIKVQVEFKDGSKISNLQEISEDTLAYKIGNSMAGSINILRRSQLLSAIFAQPKERYDLLKPFLPLTTVNEFESSLKDVVDKLSGELKKINVEIENKKRSIQNTLEIKDIGSIKVENVIKIISDRGKEFRIGDLENLDQVPDYIAKVEDYIKNIGSLNYDSDARDFLNLVDGLINKQSPAHFAEIIFNSINSKLDLIQKQKVVFYEEFLTTGIKWLRDENKSLCPFCESPIDIQSVIEKINKRIAENSTYSWIKKDFQRDYSILQGELKSWQDAVVKMRSINKKINDEEIEKLCKTIEDSIRNFIDSVPKSIQNNIILKKLPEWDDTILQNIKKLNIKYRDKLLTGDTVSLINKSVNFKHIIKTVNDSLVHINNKIDEFNLVNKRYWVTNHFIRKWFLKGKNLYSRFIMTLGKISTITTKKCILKRT